MLKMLKTARLHFIKELICVRNNSLSCNSVYKNPCDRLQEHLTAPLLGENEAPFRPSIEEMQKAEFLFKPHTKHEIKFVGTAISKEDFPDYDFPEVAFVGRSNVGKSSLLDAILKEAPNLKIRISKKPGKTRSCHFYTIGSSLALIDMPGYGYNQPKNFADSVETYLTTRKNLKRTFLLLDGDAGFGGWDEVAVEMLESFRIPYGLILTKIDKCRDSKLINNVMSIQRIRDKKMSTYCFPQPFLTSSKKMEGIAHLQAFIAYTTGCLT